MTRVHWVVLVSQIVLISVLTLPFTRCETDVDECTQGTLCQNGGTCVNRNGTFSCTCPSDFFGDFCEKGATEVCDGTRCVNGFCNNITDTNDQGTNVTTFNCTCDPGYYGYSCVNLTWEYECSLVPCSNGGTCERSFSPPYYTCNCVTGYAGATCDVNIDDCPVGACKNGGQCVDGDNTYACNCSSTIYWDGTDCSQDIDECVVKQPCQNEGLCLNLNYTGGLQPGYICDCTAFFEGIDCEKDIDECSRDVCKNGANCTNYFGGYDCNCTLGYTGKDCDVPDCDLISCQNSATCAVVGNKWQCQCLDFYEGEFCEIKGPCADRPCEEANTISCHQDVVANNYTCLCKAGWTGNTCQTDIDECQEPTTCFNNGTCQNKAGGFECQCPPEYQGERCVDDVDECTTDNPCLNGGACNNIVGGFTCNCSGTGYTNATCEDDIDECEDSPCLNEAGCRNLNGSYYCVCLEDFEGKDCASKRVMEEELNIWFIIGPCVAIFLILIVIGVVWFLMCMRKKRATRGAYSPSRQEVSGSRVELGNVLKKPPLERLI